MQELEENVRWQWVLKCAHPSERVGHDIVGTFDIVVLEVVKVVHKFFALKSFVT